jgi:hypothetical protein
MIHPMWRRIPVLVAVLGALAAGAAGAGAQPVGSPPCGASTQSTVTAAYLASTMEIYGEELDSPEVHDDLAHITAAADLATAVANDDVAATLAATTRIVYHPAWHIVRLRVISSSGQVLADVGGPSILAPVRGSITYHGGVVGSFVMSVQDDLGYEKLVTRFTALPIELYKGGKPLMGRDLPAADVPPRDPPNGTRMKVAGKAAISESYNVLAFPTGQTRVLIAVPPATAALAQNSCAVVNGLTYGVISTDLAKLFKLPQDAQRYVDLNHAFDNQKLTFVRQGATQVASSDGQLGPTAIPTSGTVVYNGESWFVYSFVPTDPHLRVYLLFPLAPSTGTTGTSGST